MKLPYVISPIASMVLPKATSKPSSIWATEQQTDGEYGRGRRRKPWHWRRSGRPWPAAGPSTRRSGRGSLGAVGGGRHWRRPSGAAGGGRHRPFSSDQLSCSLETVKTSGARRSSERKGTARLRGRHIRHLAMEAGEEREREEEKEQEVQLQVELREPDRPHPPLQALVAAAAAPEAADSSSRSPRRSSTRTAPRPRPNPSLPLAGQGGGYGRGR